MKLSIRKIVAVACALAITSVALTANAEGDLSNPLKIRSEARLEKKNEIEKEKRGELKDLRASSTIEVRSLRKDFDDDRKNLRTSTIGIIKDARKELNDDRDDCRNLIVSSTTLGVKRDCFEDRKEDRKDFRASTTMMRKELRASTTDMFKRFKNDRKEVILKMRKDAFEIRKGALVEHLNFALDNLLNIRDRINERIKKVEGEGRNMTEARAALVVADEKLAKAKIAIDTLASLSVNENVSAALAASTTIEIELNKPRQIGDAAIKAVKEARDALKKVIDAIAKNMGRGRGNGTATTTASTTTI